MTPKVQFSFLVSPELYTRFAHLARQRELPVSRLAREVLTEWVEWQEGGEPGRSA